MGDVIAADFKAKKNLGKVETPLETGLAIIAEAIATAPKSIDDIPWQAPESDPA